MNYPETYWASIPSQTFLVADGKIGDCWRCCIAAILRTPAAEVPHFLQQSIEAPRGPSMDPLTQEWLNAKGYYLLHTEGGVHMPRMWSDQPDALQPPPVIACGPTPRSKAMGEHHAVVMIGSKMVYDPHPDKTGLTAITDRYLIMPFYETPALPSQA